MASMYCWPSVSIKRGASLVIARKIVKAEFEWTFGYLLIVIDSSFSNEQVARFEYMYLSILYLCIYKSEFVIILIFILPTYRPYVCLFFARET